jgi:type IV secretory pathway VirD2 relaxase
MPMKVKAARATLRKEKMSRPLDDKHGITLGGTSRKAKSERALSTTCRGIARIMRISAATSRNKRSSAAREKFEQRQAKSKAAAGRQRAAVRVTYVTSKTAGHWKAHGLYIQREAATGKEHAGFNQEGKGIDIPSTLDSWQKDGDERLFRIIISPEAGTRLDMERYTRETMAKIQADTGTKLEWVAAIHTNTDHPHAHVALRGVMADGKPLSFSKDYIKTGFREHAQDAATAQLGFRTEKEIDTAAVAEVTKSRQTSLDQIIVKNCTAQAEGLIFAESNPSLDKLRKYDPVKVFLLERRLQHLEKMGLAKRLSDDTWQLPKDFTSQLKALSFAGDKQRMLTNKMEPASAVGSDILSAKWNDIDILQGRVLGHNEDENSGKRYMIIESVDGKVVMLPHRSDTEALRAKKGLKNNELITIKRHHGRIIVQEHGNADESINNDAISRSLRSGHSPAEQRPGWLGRLDKAIAKANTPHSYVTLSKQDVEILLAGEQLRPQKRAALEEAMAKGESRTVTDAHISIQFHNNNNL